ncbi:hypothetical protein PARMER_03610 [Parabacteroides merdae ATCC 43184]|nr:hypothetical protein PARMER_03610 [Parabacteroides merdae ATCC 43184]
MMGTPGSQAALQAVFDKRKACLDEKRSEFHHSGDDIRSAGLLAVVLHFDKPG